MGEVKEEAKLLHVYITKKAPQRLSSQGVISSGSEITACSGYTGEVLSEMLRALSRCAVLVWATR